MNSNMLVAAVSERCTPERVTRQGRMRRIEKAEPGFGVSWLGGDSAAQACAPPLTPAATPRKINDLEKKDIETTTCDVTPNPRRGPLPDRCKGRARGGRRSAIIAFPGSRPARPPIHVRRTAPMRMLVKILFLIWLAAGAGRAGAADITVFAAASLKEALDENVRAFSLRTGHQVRVSYAGSNALARQIENGAPADLFLSADEDWMDYVARRQLIEPGTRRNLLLNTLVLVAPADSDIRLAIGPNFGLQAALKGGRLALANPDTVPIGKYARAALAALGVWEGVEKSLTRSENVRAALVLVARGEAPLGIVYATDARAEPRTRVVDTFAPGLHPPVVYPGALVAGRKNPAAQALLDYLGAAEARAVWTRYGFGIAR
jgi:molybdate transport system substrate-binding protein